MAKYPHIGAIEIGTGHVRVVIGEVGEEDRELRVIGVGEVESRGVKKGEVIDFREASKATHEAIVKAEKGSGVTLEGAYLLQSGGHLSGFLNEASVNVGSSDNYVKEGDVERVLREARNKELGVGRVYIHHIQGPFRLDGRMVRNPVGMQGGKLQVGYWSIHGDLRKVRDAIHIVNGFGIKVEDVMFSGIGAAMMVTSEEERRNGVLVVNVGQGTTDYVLYRDGYIVYTGVLPIGGDHLTNDLSLGLRISYEQAEGVKVKWGSVEGEEGEGEREIIEVGLGKEKRGFEKGSVEAILHARVEELFEVVKKTLKGYVEDGIAGGVILTGGTGRLRGMAGVAGGVFGVEARVGENVAFNVGGELLGPEYSAVLGLLYYGYKNKGMAGVEEVREGGKKGSLIGRFAELLKLR